MKRLLSLMVLSLAFVLTGCESEENLEVNQLVVGLECDYAPYNWTVTKSQASEIAVQIDGSNQYCDGYDVQVARTIADELELELVVKKISWDGLPNSLQIGQIDAIIAGMSPTPERKQTMNFTDAYFTEVSEQAVIVKSDSVYADGKTLNDFNGATFIAQLGTFQIELINQLDGAVAGTHLTDYPSVINSVLNGVNDGYIAELSVAEAHVANNENLTLIRFIDGFVLDPSYNTVAIALRLDDTDLQADLNGVLDNISEETRVEWMEAASSRSDE